MGHDPLREDADAEALWARIKDSKKPIGGILMDQTLIAGVGNIYRAEVRIQFEKPIVPFAWNRPAGNGESSM